MRGRGEVLVCVHAGAAAGVARHVQCLPERPNLARACPRRHTLHLVVSPIPDPVKHTRVEGLPLESSAFSSGSSFDVGAFDGGSRKACG